MNLEPFARLLIIFGLLIALIGGILFLISKSGLPLFHLPGDIRIQTSNFTCFFPLATMIIVSVVLTVLLNVIIRLINK